jgi:hypothetical protein
LDSEELAVPIDTEKVNKNRVGADWEIITETPSKGDAWIWKRSQPLLTLKKSTKQLPKVTCGLGRARSPCDSEIVNENRVAVDYEIITEIASKGDEWIRKRLQPLLTKKWSMKTESLPTQKSSPKHLSKVTRGFRRARGPY